MTQPCKCLSLKLTEPQLGAVRLCLWPGEKKVQMDLFAICSGVGDGWRSYGSRVRFIVRRNRSQYGIPFGLPRGAYSVPGHSHTAWFACVGLPSVQVPSQPLPRQVGKASLTKAVDLGPSPHHAGHGRSSARSEHPREKKNRRIPMPRLLALLLLLATVAHAFVMQQPVRSLPVAASPAAGPSRASRARPPPCSLRSLRRSCRRARSRSRETR